MRLSQRLTQKLLATFQGLHSASRKRHRRLFLEQFEDRRVLASAGDDNFWLLANDSLTAPFYFGGAPAGLLSNDSCEAPENWEPGCQGFLGSDVSNGTLAQNWDQDRASGN
jgi:hypothetical protein